ncbi:hypothetical protein HDU81_007698 [Chytriomyces hyalinus]|nr:hypothetical protein HDU81_007698 [Chytriomyces hyalinus]
MFRGCGCDFAVTIPRGSSAEAECADSSDGPNASVDSITISNPPLIRRTFPSALVKSKGNSAGFEYLRELTFTDEALKGAALSQAEMLPSLTRKIDISNNKDLEPWPGLTADGSKPFYSFEQVTQRNVPNPCCPPGTPDAITCFPSSSICKGKPGSTSSSSSGATSGSGSSPAPVPAPPSSGTGESGSGVTLPNQKPPAEKPVTMAKPTTATTANVPPVIPTVAVAMKTMVMGMPEGKPGMGGSAEVTGKKGGETSSTEVVAVNAEGKETTAKGEAAKGEGKAEKKEEVQISTVAKIVGITILGVFVVGVVIAATRMAMAGGGHEKKHVVEDIEAK